MNQTSSNNRDRTGTIVRNCAWRNFEVGGGEGFTSGTVWHTPTNVEILLDASNEPCGYLVFDDTNDWTAVAELGYTTEAVFESFAALMTQRASKEGNEKVHMA